MMKRTFYLFLVLTLGALRLSAQNFDWALYGIQGDKPLVTDANQLTSPYSDEAEGLHIKYMLDGDVNTFWHSDWHGRVPSTPYFEVSLPEPIEGFVALHGPPHQQRRQPVHPLVYRRRPYALPRWQGPGG